MQDWGEIINFYGWVRLFTCMTWAKKLVFFSCGLAGGRRGFCNKWQQKWFLSASSSWDSVGEDSSLAVLVDWLCTVR